MIMIIIKKDLKTKLYMHNTHIGDVAMTNSNISDKHVICIILCSKINVLRLEPQPRVYS